MIFSRTAPSETCGDSQTPCWSGPRWVRERVICFDPLPLGAGLRVSEPGNPAQDVTDSRAVLGKPRILGRREQFFERQQTPAQIAAGQLPRSRVDVDIAADAMQIQRQRIDEGLPRVVAKRLASARCLLVRRRRLFQPPARLVHFAVRVRVQFLAQHAAIGRSPFVRSSARPSASPADDRSGNDTPPLPGPSARTPALSLRPAAVCVEEVIRPSGGFSIEM